MATPTAQGKTTKGDWKDKLEDAIHDAAHKHGPGEARLSIEIRIGNPHVRGYRVTLTE
jgi:hypothetical protein